MVRLGGFTVGNHTDDWTVSSGTNTSIALATIVDDAGLDRLDPSHPPRTQSMKRIKQKQAIASATKARTQCALSGDRRTLTLIPRKSGCQLTYQNRSGVEIVAEAQWGKQVCQQVRTQIISKLRSSGYRCG